MNSTIDRNQIQARLDARQDIRFIEALPQRFFAAEHLPGAINIPHDAVKELAPGLLPDKNAFLVVYCSNTACQNSGIAAATLRQLGYKQVFQYEAGKEDWINAGNPIEQTRQAG